MKLIESKAEYIPQEEGLDREIIIFDGPSHYTPYKVEILDGQFNHLQ